MFKTYLCVIENFVNRFWNKEDLSTITTNYEKKAISSLQKKVERALKRFPSKMITSWKPEYVKYVKHTLKIKCFNSSSDKNAGL